MTHGVRPPTDIRKYRPKIHPTLAKAILWCIEQSVEKRCPSMDDFLQAIRGVEKEEGKAETMIEER